MTTSKKHRLTDILTKEVSMVDKAANKRKFLLVKRDGSTPTEITPDGKGGFSSAPAETVEKTETPAEPEKLTVSKSTREQLVATIEKLTLLANSTVEGESDAEQLTKALGEALEAFAAEEPVAEPSALVVGLEKADRAEVQKALSGAAGKLGEIAESLAIVVTDSDEAWPSDLRWKIENVLSALSVMARLEQSDPGAAAMVAHAVNKSEETPAEAPAPVVDTAEAERFKAVAKALQNALESATSIADDTNVNLEADGAEVLLTKAVSIITKLKKRVDTLEAQPSLPNAQPAERGPAQVTKSESTVWPSDMNRDSKDNIEF